MSLFTTGCQNIRLNSQHLLFHNILSPTVKLFSINIYIYIYIYIYIFLNSFKCVSHKLNAEIIVLNFYLYYVFMYLEPLGY